jgi:DNA-binding Lrp family transcriptional regulator
MDVRPAFETPAYDVAAQQGAGFGYGYGQNFGPTAASIPGLVAGGGIAGAIDKATSKIMPNNPLLNLLRVGGVVGGSMLGAQGTSTVYDQFMGPYAGLSEDQRKTVGGVGGRMLGGPAEQLGGFGATATIFGAPALDAKNRVALFEGAGAIKSFKAITRDANALRDPAVKEFVGDFGERAYSIATSAQEIDKNNKERIQSFIAENGRVPTRDEKDAMGVLSNAEKFAKLLPDAVFGGMTRFGKGFSPETGYNALGDIASGIQARRDARQGAGAQTPGVTVTTPGTATMTPTSTTGRALNINIQLPSGNGFKPYRITFDQSTGTAQIIEPRIYLPSSFGIPISTSLSRKPPVTVANTTYDIRGVTKDGDFIVLSTDKLTGAQTLETKSFNELPDAWKPTVERTFKDTVVGGQRRNVNTLPTDVSYNPKQDALTAYEDTYKTKVNIDGTEVNAAITSIDGNMVTVRLPSGNQFTLPKSFFPNPDDLKVARLGNQTRQISGYKNKVDGVDYAAAESFNGTDYFIPEVNRKQVKDTPGLWGALFGRIPAEADRYATGTVLDLGALNGEQQIGIVLGFEQFDINGQPSGGYKVKLLNDPRVDAFYVPQHSTIAPIDPRNNPFVTGGAPATPAVAPTAPVDPATTSVVPPSAPVVTPAPAIATGPVAPVLPEVPTIAAPLTSGVTLEDADYRRIVAKIKQFIETTLSEGSMPSKGDLDVSAIALAIGESADDVDAAVDRLMKDGILREEGGVFDFEGLKNNLNGYAFARPDESAPLPAPGTVGAAVVASPEDGVPVDTAGRIEYTKSELEKGPLTKTGLANKLKIKADEALSILEGLEAEGVIESFKNGNRPGTYYRLVPVAPAAPVAPVAPTVEDTSTDPRVEDESSFWGPDLSGPRSPSPFGDPSVDEEEGNPFDVTGGPDTSVEAPIDPTAGDAATVETGIDEEGDPLSADIPGVVEPLVPATRAPRPATEQTDIPTPEGQVFPYKNEFGEPAAPDTLPVEMEDYREGDTRYRRQTKGEETKRFTADEFRRAVPRWASAAGGFSKFVGRLLVPLVDKFQNQGFLDIEAQGVSNKQELQVALQDVFGQTSQQSAALAEWVDRFSLGWAREFARLHGIGTMERLRAVRLSTDPSIDISKLTSNHDTWKRYYREQMLSVHSEENAQILRELQTIFYTQRLGVLSKMSTAHQAMLGGATGFTFSVNGDGRRVVNVVMSLYGSENYNTQVHEINHALVRALYAPMIHELASKYYQTYVQNNNAKKDRIIQRDLEERIVTELTNMMFNSPEAGDYNFFADNEHVEGGFDSTLNALIMNIGSEMRKSIIGLPEDNPNNLAYNKHWATTFPDDIEARQQINKGTPLIIEQEIPFVGKRRKTVFLAEPIKPGQDITVQDGYRDPKTGAQKYKNKRKIPQSDVQAIGQNTVTGLEPGAREYFVKFMGHWYDYTVNMINKYTDDVDVAIDNFDQVQVADVKRLTVGYKWFDTVADAKKEVGTYGDWPDTRIEYRTSESYLGWADKGGYEVYLKG